MGASYLGITHTSHMKATDQKGSVIFLRPHNHSEKKNIEGRMSPSLCPWLKSCHLCPVSALLIFLLQKSISKFTFPLLGHLHHDDLVITN